jgi:hypothetical protein
MTLREILAKAKLYAKHVAAQEGYAWDTPEGANCCCTKASGWFIDWVGQGLRHEVLRWPTGHKRFLCHDVALMPRRGREPVVVDLTLRQFISDAPYPTVLPLSTYQDYVRTHGAQSPKPLPGTITIFPEGA